ncbi:MAG: HAD family hydrolase [Synergistaceae bacterium]|jgi:phosphoglycolate phosphatase-like HAD superfamily hydrolase|nr:HAD family hydrolase [Synergistaceae bacterium]
MVFPPGGVEFGNDSDFSPDCLIFDVDGVLIEADKSFPEMIRAVVEDLWHGAGFVAESPGYSAELNYVFKRHGSFNDDYDIAWSLLNIMAFRSGTNRRGENGKRSPEFPLSPEELGDIISRCAGDCVEWMRSAFPERFGREHVREMCVRTYFGLEEQKGMYAIETPLLRSHWRSLPLPAYIYTGRNGAEWGLAKEILSWEDFPDERVIGFDSGIRKPSPRGLFSLCDAFGHERPMFFGDTASDRKAWEAFGKGHFVAIGDILRDDKPNFANVEDALFCILGWRREKS